MFPGAILASRAWGWVKAAYNDSGDAAITLELWVADMFGQLIFEDRGVFSYFTQFYYRQRKSRTTNPLSLRKLDVV
jgi:hypothetical protein